jgi:hypothetical protein
VRFQAVSFQKQGKRHMTGQLKPCTVITKITDEYAYNNISEFERINELRVENRVRVDI